MEIIRTARIQDIFDARKLLEEHKHEGDTQGLQVSFVFQNAIYIQSIYLFSIIYR